MANKGNGGTSAWEGGQESEREKRTREWQKKDYKFACGPVDKCLPAVACMYVYSSTLLVSNKAACTYLPTCSMRD